MTFTPGPWYPPHLSDDTTKCNCHSVVSESYAGGICSVDVNNGIPSISDGGNDAPPLEEAKANGIVIALVPDLIRELKYVSKLFELYSGHRIPPSTLAVLKIIKEVESK